MVAGRRSVIEGGRQGRAEAVGDSRWTGRHDQREAAPGASRCAHEEVTQRDGQGIDPLEVIDEQRRRTLSGQLAVDRLEEADGIEPADVGVGIEQTEEGPILARGRESTEER